MSTKPTTPWHVLTAAQAAAQFGDEAGSGLTWGDRRRRGDPRDRRAKRHHRVRSGVLRGEGAESNRFDSILMATSRLGLMSEMILGSVAAKVLRTRRIPVEVVPASPRAGLRSHAGPAGAVAGVLGLTYLTLERVALGEST